MECLVFVDVNGKYVVDEQAKTTLMAINRPCSVVSIAGRYRTGKSTLLNTLLHHKIFSTSSTVNAHTKGLSFFVDPTSGLLFVDTEGLGSVQVSKKHDAAIFALAMSISSVCCYNTIGTITSQSLEELVFTTRFMNVLSTLQLQTPLLIWILRDFSLELKNEDGQGIHVNEYMEQCVADSTFDLRALFKQYEALALPRPTDHVDSMHDQTNTSADFQKCIHQLLARLQLVQPGTCGSQVLTGPLIVDILETLCHSLNESDDTLSIDSTWDMFSAKMKQRVIGTIEHNVAQDLPFIQRVEESLRFYIRSLPDEMIHVEDILTMVTTLLQKSDGIEAELKIQLGVVNHVHEECQTTLEAHEKQIDYLMDQIKTHTVEKLQRTTMHDETTLELKAAKERINVLQSSLNHGVATLRQKHKKVVMERDEAVRHAETITGRLTRLQTEKDKILSSLKRKTEQYETVCIQSDTMTKYIQDEKTKNQELETECRIWKARQEERTKKRKYSEAELVNNVALQTENDYLRNISTAHTEKLIGLIDENTQLKHENQRLSVLCALE